MVNPADGSRFDASRELSSALLEVFPDLCFLTDAEGTVLAYHALDERELYTQPSQFVGRRIDEVFPSTLATQYLQHMQLALTGHKVVTYEYDLDIGADTRRFEARLSATEAGACISIIRDVTEFHSVRRQLVIERQRMSERLKEQRALDAVITLTTDMERSMVDPKNRTTR